MSRGFDCKRTPSGLPARFRFPQTDRGMLAVITWLCDLLHLVGEITSGGGRRQWLTVQLIKRDRFLHDFAQVVEDLPFVVTVAPALNQSLGLPPTTRRSLRIARSLSFLRLLDSKLYSSDLVMLCIVAGFARYGHGLRDVRVNKVSMAPFTSTAYEPCTFELGNELFHSWRH